MKNKNPQQNHLCSLFFSLFQSLYLCFTLTQILTLTFEGKCLVPVIVTICSIFPSLFVRSLLILSLQARGSAVVFFARCVLKNKGTAAFYNPVPDHILSSCLPPCPKAMKAPSLMEKILRKVIGSLQKGVDYVHFRA